MMNLSRATVLLLFFLIPLPSGAANSLNVVINEINWSGTSVSYNDEWIELYNNTENQIILDGWSLEIGTSSSKINLKGEIPAKNYYLMEMTDDNTVPAVMADFIYTGSLKNGGDIIKLYDSSENLIDYLDCSLGWFAGDNKTKQTMERISFDLPTNDSSNWQMGQVNGTPKSENNKKADLPEENPKESVLENGFARNYPEGIIISELLPSPEGPDAENEWIEISNQNDYEVDLSGWKISDTIGSVTTYILPDGTIISNQGFLVFYRPETKIILNNDGDSLKLIKPDGSIASEVSYEKSPNNRSYSLAEKGWAWSSVLTPNAINVISNNNGSTVEMSTNTEKASKEAEQDDNLASINKSFQKIIEQEKNNNSSPVAAIALITSSLCGAIILYLKRSLLKKEG
jgi:hypothetical protein